MAPGETALGPQEGDAPMRFLMRAQGCSRAGICGLVPSQGFSAPVVVTVVSNPE